MMIYLRLVHKNYLYFNCIDQILCNFSAHVIPRGLSPPPTADVIDITVLNDQLVISRPEPWVKRFVLDIL